VSPAPNPNQPNPTVERNATVLETDEDLRQALLSGLKGPQQPVPVESKPAPAPAPATSAARPATLFRPTARPPVPILTVFDDGKMDGEVIRIREPRFTIGRTEGDLRFPLDGRMSAKHVEITHQVVGGLHRWVVTDLQSTHGMFVRVSRTALADQAEILIGDGRYRFDAAQVERDATADHIPSEQNFGQTQGLDDGANLFRPPALTELLGREIGNRIVLIKQEYWIGSDPSCQVCRPDDPFCEARHARLHRNSRGNWYAEHNKTQNGLWLRMAQITAEGMIYFQIGEQRFKLKV
jgi:pSer/pThr/pTyr-binding forkhead associated (FHA) protein